MIGLILIGLGCFGVGFSLRGIIDNIVGKKEPENVPLVRDISLEELSALLKTFEEQPEEKPFDELVMDWMKETDRPNLVNTSDSYVVVEAPCIGNDCTQSPAREDCCTGDYNAGKCKIYVNINKLCGIEDVITRDPKLITPAEAEMLAAMLTKYIKENNK